MNIKKFDELFENSEIDVEIDFVEDVNERRAPKIRKKQREANAVKSKATKELFGPGGKYRTQVEKMFRALEKEIKRQAKGTGVSISRVKLDKITLRLK